MAKNVSFEVAGDRANPISSSLSSSGHLQESPPRRHLFKEKGQPDVHVRTDNLKRNVSGQNINDPSLPPTEREFYMCFSINRASIQRIILQQKVHSNFNSNAPYTNQSKLHIHSLLICHFKFFLLKDISPASFIVIKNLCKTQSFCPAFVRFSITLFP